MMIVFLLGAILSVVGFIMILVQAFRSSVLWGLAILIGTVVIEVMFSRNLLVNGILSFALIGLFAAQHWHETRTALIIYAVGCVLALAGLKEIAHINDEAQSQTAKKSTQEAIESRPYVPSPVPISPTAIIPPPQQVAQPQPEEPAPIVTRVYADNKTKLYYARDCAKHPENAYVMAKSLAVSQGYKPAACIP